MKKAFTLIELLVVIAIIALLSTLSVVALNSARVKARDARRLSDVGQIRTALAMYYDSAKSFPASLTTGQPIGYGGMVFLSKMPSDPISANQYTYTQTDGGSSYTLDFTLEADSGGYTTGNYQLTPNGVIAGGGGSTPPAPNFVCGFVLTDGDYGYKTTSVGNYCVMVQSLKRESNDRRCYDEEETNCENYGGLYYVSNSTNLCPAGWRLPNRTESSLFSALCDLNKEDIIGYYNSETGGFEGDKYIMLDEQGYLLDVSSAEVFMPDNDDNGVSVRCVKDPS